MTLYYLIREIDNGRRIRREYLQICGKRWGKRASALKCDRQILIALSKTLGIENKTNRKGRIVYSVVGVQ